MLGPLNIATEETSPQLQPVPTGEPGRPGQQAPSTLFVPHDPVGEASQQEERSRHGFRKYAPAVFDAREAVDAAQREHLRVVLICQEREQAVIRERNAVSNANREVMGERGDAESRLAICEGYATVARHNVALAQENLNATLVKLAEATGAKL